MCRYSAPCSQLESSFAPEVIILCNFLCNFSCSALDVQILGLNFEVLASSVFRDLIVIIIFISMSLIRLRNWCRMTKGRLSSEVFNLIEQLVFQFL